MLDGGEITNPVSGNSDYYKNFNGGPEGAIPTPVESIQEFNVETNNPSGSQSLSLGGGAQVVAVAAAQVQVTAGAQSRDMASQALAFLPNELWIYSGESVTWAFPTGEIHTVTFLRPSQVRPPFPVGCPGTTPSGSPATAASCVNSGILAGGAS